MWSFVIIFLSLVSHSTELNKYYGFYTSKQTALKFFVYINRSDLIIEPINQPEAILKSIGNNNFECTRLRTVLEFNNEKDEVIVKRNGNNLLFTRSEIADKYFGDLKLDFNTALTINKRTKK